MCMSSIIFSMASPKPWAAGSWARAITGIATAAAMTARKRGFMGGSPWLAAEGRLTYRSEEHTSELQSLMRISYAVFCLKKQKENTTIRRCIQNAHNQYNT